MSEVAEAIQQIREQREFLLTNVWRPGDPASFARSSFNRGGQDFRVGCLVERCVLEPTQTRYGQKGFVKGWGITNFLAHRAIFWTLMEMGYEDLDEEEGPYVDRCMSINDDQFTQPGEAIEALERTLINIKSAFGETGEDTE